MSAKLQQPNPAFLLRAQIAWSNVGKVADVLLTPWVTLQKTDIMCRTLEAAFWFCLGFWSNNVGNSHLSFDIFNCRVLHCSHSLHWYRHQRRLPNCDCIPVSYTSGQSSCPCRHLTCWASSQRSHTVCSMPCHGAWTPALLCAMETGHFAQV